MRLRHLLVLAVTGALVVGAGLPGTAGAEAVLGGFSARPLDPSGNPALRSYFKWHVRPGGRYVGVLLVSNAEKVTVHLRIYPVDGLTGVTSGAVYPTGQAPLRRDGRWLTPDLTNITIPPLSQRTLRFTARIPAGARPGDHIAAIVLENADHPRAAHGSIAIIQVIRSAVAVEMRVAGPTHSALAATGLALRSLPGTDIASAIVNLSNTGDLLCKPRLRVSIAQGGSAAVTVTRRLDLILPGDSIPFPLAWPRPLVAGTYTMSAVATGCGPVTSLRRSVSLGTSLRGNSPSGAVPVAAAPARASTPWLLIGLVGGVGVFLGWLLSRRRRPDTPSSSV
jgi:hypothetical protein